MYKHKNLLKKQTKRNLYYYRWFLAQRLHMFPLKTAIALPFLWYLCPVPFLLCLLTGGIAPEHITRLLATLSRIDEMASSFKSYLSFIYVKYIKRLIKDQRKIWNINKKLNFFRTIKLYNFIGRKNVITFIQQMLSWKIEKNTDCVINGNKMITNSCF